MDIIDSRACMRQDHHTKHPTLGANSNVRARAHSCIPIPKNSPDRSGAFLSDKIRGRGTGRQCRPPQQPISGATKQSALDTQGTWSIFCTLPMFIDGRFDFQQRGHFLLGACTEIRWMGSNCGGGHFDVGHIRFSRVGNTVLRRNNAQRESEPVDFSLAIPGRNNVADSGNLSHHVIAPGPKGATFGSVFQ